MPFRVSSRLPAVTASLAVAALVTWLLLWRPFSAPQVTDQAVLQLQLRTAGEGKWSFYFDGGHGIPVDRAAETAVSVQKDATATRLTVPVPPGRLVEVRCETEGATELKILGGSIRTASGRQLALLTPQQIHGVGKTTGANENGALVLRAPATREPLVFSVRFAPPLLVPSGTEPSPVAVILTFSAALGAALLLGRWKLRMEWTAALWAKVALRPKTAILCTAVLATIASSYPVVFLGKSFVSPNTIAYLLYPGEPTIPGAPREPLEYAAGSDLGATMWQNLPYSVVESQAIFRDHEIPLWNRYNSAGLPLLGQGLSMLGDPLHLIPVLPGGAWWAWDIKFLLAKALFALGIGLCARSTTRHLGATLLTTASSVWIGFFAYRFNHPAFFSVCYAPWLLLVWLAAVQAQTRKGLWTCAGLLILADWMELCSGTAKESAILLLCLNVVGFSLFLRAANGWRRVRPMVWTSILFLLLSAPCWLVFLDALRQSVTIYDIPHAYQLQPGLLIAFFESIFSQDFTKQQNITHPSLNLFVLLGVLWAICTAKSRGERTLWAAAGIAAAFVFGIIPPAWIVRIPFLGRIEHIYNTFGCVLMILLLVVAAKGFAACLDRADEQSWLSTWKRTVAILAGMLLLYAGFTQAIPQPPQSSFHLEAPVHSRFFTLYLPALLVSFLALPWAARWSRGSKAGWILAAICFFVLHFRSGMYTETKFHAYVMNPRTGVDLVARSAAVQFTKTEAKEPWRMCGFDTTLSPGYQSVLGVEGIAGPDALHNPWYSELCTATGMNRAWGWRLMVAPETLGPLKPVYDLLNLRFYLRERDGEAAALPGLGMPTRGDLDVYESHEAWPRAFYTDHWVASHSAGEFSRMLQHGDGRPFAAIADEMPEHSEVQFSRRVTTAAQDYRLTNNTTEFTVTASGPGVAVLGECYERGNFRVTVNDRPVSYFRVNQAFKGVFLPQAGTYRIRFAYWPKVLTPALWMALLGSILSLGTAAVYARRTRAVSFS